jgi:membrane fusion protein (multidrug efflux system)
VQDAVFVPVSALRKGPAGDHVFVIGSGEKGEPRAAIRNVRAGEVIGDEVVILEGVKPGDQVATSGSFKLRDGVMVQVSDPSAQQAQQDSTGGAQ